MFARSVRKIPSLFLLIAVLAGLAAGCTAEQTPANAIENYLQALAAKDQTAAVSNSCAAWEEQALAEGASFINVEVNLEGLSCQTENQADTLAEVSCTGKFIFSYDAGEDQELDLSGRTFSVTKEGGDWRMCGYQK